MEEILYRWTEKNKILFNFELKEKATELMQNKKFKASNNWLYRFKRKYKLLKK